MLCVVVLNYNDVDTTCNFVQQIVSYDEIDKIIIVDNASTDNSYHGLKMLESVKVDVLKTDKNGGYGYGNNFGIRYAYNMYHATHIIVSNPDVEVSEETIKHCRETLDKKKCALVAPMMRNQDYSINYKCVWKVPSRNQYRLFSTLFLGRLFSGFYYSKDELDEKHIEKKVGCVAGSFFMVDAEKMIRFGMFDENIFLYCEETVLGLKFQKTGFDVMVLLDDYFVHHHSVSINKSIMSKVSQRKITWKSRLYVLKNYYNSTMVDLSIDKIISKTEILEYKIISILKNRY